MEDDFRSTKINSRDTKFEYNFITTFRRWEIRFRVRYQKSPADILLLEIKFLLSFQTKLALIYYIKHVWYDYLFFYQLTFDLKFKIQFKVGKNLNFCNFRIVATF